MERRLLNVLKTIIISENETVNILRREPIPLDAAIQIPQYRFVIERFLTLSEENKHKETILLVGKEVMEVCDKINIVTLTRRNVTKKIEQYVDEYKQLFVKLPIDQRNTTKYKSRCEEWVEKLQWGFPVMTPDSQKKINTYTEELQIMDFSSEDDLYKVKLFVKLSLLL